VRVRDGVSKLRLVGNKPHATPTVEHLVFASLCARVSAPFCFREKNEHENTTGGGSAATSFENLLTATYDAGTFRQANRYENETKQMK